MPFKLRHNSILFATIGFAVVVIIVALVGVYALGRDPEHIQGEVEAGEYRVSSKVSGRILEIRVKEGDYVKAGDTLVVIDAPEARAKLEQAAGAEEVASALELKTLKGEHREKKQEALSVLQQARAGKEIAEKSYHRIQQLFDEGAVSVQKRDEAYANFKAMEAQLKAAQSQYQEMESYLRETVLTAQEDGEVCQVYPKVGELVGMGTPLIAISLMSDMWGAFIVREDQLNGLQVGSELTAFVAAFNKSIRMKIFSLNEQGPFPVRKATKDHGRNDMKTFKMKARPMEKLDGLRPGMTLVIL